MKDIDIEKLKKAWFSFEEIMEIVETEKEYEQDWISYSLEEAFWIVKNEIFSKKNFKNV